MNYKRAWKIRMIQLIIANILGIVITIFFWKPFVVDAYSKGNFSSPGNFIATLYAWFATTCFLGTFMLAHTKTGDYFSTIVYRWRKTTFGFIGDGSDTATALFGVIMATILMFPFMVVFIITAISYPFTSLFYFLKRHDTETFEYIRLNESV